MKLPWVKVGILITIDIKLHLEILENLDSQADSHTHWNTLCMKTECAFLNSWHVQGIHWDVFHVLDTGFVHLCLPPYNRLCLTCLPASLSVFLLPLCGWDLPVCCGSSPQDFSLFRPSAERAVGLTWLAGIRAGRSQVPLKSGHALPLCSINTQNGSGVIDSQWQKGHVIKEGKRGLIDIIPP